MEIEDEEVKKLSEDLDCVVCLECLRTFAKRIIELKLAALRAERNKFWEAPCIPAMEEIIQPTHEEVRQSLLAQVETLKTENEALRAEVEQARKTSQFHKDNHLAVERLVDRLRKAAKDLAGNAQRHQRDEDGNPAIFVYAEDIEALDRALASEEENR